MKEVSSGKKEFKNTQQKKMLFSKAYSNSPLISNTYNKLIEVETF